MDEQSVPPTHKLCTRKDCRRTGQLIPMDEFYNHPKSKDGKASWCKECMKESSKKDQASKKGKKRRRVYAKKNADGPEALARRHVRDLVKRGLMVKPTVCFRCKRPASEVEGTPEGSCGPLSFHHTKGYTPQMWAVGEWLCRVPCHEQADAEAGVQRTKKNRGKDDESTNNNS